MKLHLHARKCQEKRVGHANASSSRSPGKSSERLKVVVAIADGYKVMLEERITTGIFLFAGFGPQRSILASGMSWGIYAVLGCKLEGVHLC